MCQYCNDLAPLLSSLCHTSIGFCPYSWGLIYFDCNSFGCLLRCFPIPKVFAGNSPQFVKGLCPTRPLQHPHIVVTSDQRCRSWSTACAKAPAPTRPPERDPVTFH